MSSVMNIELAGGEIIAVPFRQYTLNDDQQFVVIGINNPSHQVQGGITDGVESTVMGALSEQNFIFEARTKNTLANDEWDFEKYPDPQIILLTRLKK